MVGEAGEGKMGSYCIMDIEFQFFKIKKGLEIGSIDSCTTM